MTNNRNTFSIASFSLCFLLFATEAFAQSSGSGGVGNLAQPIVTILQSIQQTVVGPLGITVFVLGLCGLGMACLRGMIPWGWVASWIVGACFLFGAPTIVNAIQSAIGNGQ